ncbi:MAG TPA: hypothetical protein P5084_07705 [Paludibacter sp.]|nr:hypothetical protein [Paludibacter sp.]
MKTRNLAILLVSLVIFTNCFAQKENKKSKKGKTETTEEVKPTTPVVTEETAPVITEECLVNISLFNESAKNKQYADALAPWNAAYKDCPNANKAIYSRGREIVLWELDQAKDEVTYKKVFDKLMGMYDNRIKYFGTDERYPTAWILGIKGLDYVAKVKNDDLKKPAYEWLSKSIEGLNEKSELSVLNQMVVISYGLFKADPTHAEKFIADYLKVNAILETLAASEEAKIAEPALQTKQGLETLFAQSGAADCKTLDGIYKEKVAANKDNKDFLNSVIGFYRRVRCNESEVYFAASVAVHKIEPTAESAAGCGAMSYKKNEFSNAISFYDEATRLTTDKSLKADYQYTIAQIYYKEMGNYQKAREYSRNSLEFNPNNGSAYILIGIMYAKSKGIYDDPVLAKTIYWVAVDKFNKAKQVDSSVAADANKLINTYSDYFPTKEDIFFQPQLKAGASFTVGGWIGETTTCR